MTTLVRPSADSPSVPSASPADGATDPAPRAAEAATFDWQAVVSALWLVGALMAFGLFALRQARFVRALGPLTPWVRDSRVLIGRGYDGGPLVVGLLRPRIVLPADFETRFEGEARALVLAHEQVHVARGDAFINGFSVALQSLAWFNPLVHIAVRRLRVDQEIACDAAVLSRRPQSSRLYAETLIGALAAPVSAPLACHWPAGGAQPLKERLVMMSSASLSPRRKALGLGLVAVLGLAGAGAVWAANPAPASVIQQPNWVSKPTGADLVRYYPAAAAKARIGGRALLECGVANDGRLKACKVASESPSAAGFGDAAMKLSTTFQMSPQSQDGKPTANGVVRIPIMFALAPNPRP